MEERLNHAMSFGEHVVELRILSGSHRGARLPFTASVLMGSVLDNDTQSAECDVLLLDDIPPGRHLRVELRSELQSELQNDDKAPLQWQWRWLDQATPSDGYALGTFQWIGSLAITVASCEMPWSEAPAMALKESASGATSDAEIAPISSGTNATTQDVNNPNHMHHPGINSDTSSPSESGEPTAAETSAAFDDLLHGGAANMSNLPHPALPMNKRRNAGAVAILILACVVALSLVLLLIFLLTRDRPNAIIPVQNDQTVDARSLKTLTQVLASLGLDQSLKVVRTTDGQLAVVGWVADTRTRDNLAMALAQLAPMPGMQVSVESDAIAVAQAIATGVSPYLTATGNGRGTINILGVLSPGEEPDKAVATLTQVFEAQLPNATLQTGGMVSREQMLDGVRAMLKQTGLNPVRVSWRVGNANPGLSPVLPGAAPTASVPGLEIVALQDSDIRRFAPVVMKVHEIYGSRLPVLVRLGDANGGVSANALPFDIIAIIGGTWPSVIVEGGKRLLPGGEFRGYRLLAITDSQVIFDGPNRVVVAR